MASYSEANLLDPYRLIGDALLQKADRPDDLLFSGFDGLSENDRTLRYFLCHPKEVLQAMLSTRFGTYVPFLQYDPKLHLRNLPGYVCDFSREVRLIYTPTPTARHQILPEFHGALQAMMNGSHHYQSWIYVNLQDLTCQDEVRRSQNIMRLNDQYPGTFFGITLTQDSGIYQYEAKKALLDRANFSLASPYGYYFPAKTIEEQHAWRQKLEQIIDLADVVAKKLVPRQDRHSVFCDLVTLGIIEYFVDRVAKKPALFNASCKESIDRGGKINALLLWAKKGPSEITSVLSCLHARALCIRSRQIKDRRLQEAQKVLHYILHEEMKNYLTLVLQ